MCSCVFEQAEKNVYLEERLQVLQQQNEDLKERIDKNVAVSRSDKFKCILPDVIILMEKTTCLIRLV